MIKVLLNPGHSELMEGALSQCAIGEHEVNLYQAITLQNLLIPDFIVDIHDPAKDDLKEEGKKAEGYDLFISLHCNSFDKTRNYTCVCVSNKYSKPQDENVKLASKAATAIAKALNLNAYAGPKYPVGIMPADLTVLSYAHKAGCKYSFLVEPFFIDYYCNQDTIKNCADLAMKALAEVLRNEFLSRKNLKK